MSVATKPHGPLNSVAKTAERLDLKEVTIRSWMEQRKIGYVRLGRRVAIFESEIERIIEQGTVPALDPRR